jgi:hypothetical protein
MARFRRIISTNPVSTNGRLDKARHVPLLNGLRDGDSIDDLWSRLSVLPSDLEDLFKKILDHLNPEYFVQACELFQLVLFAFDGGGTTF